MTEGDCKNSAPDAEKPGEGKQTEALLLPQVFASLTCSLGYFVSGTINGWSGSSLTQLDEDFEMDATEYSLVASMIGYGALMGSLVAGKVIDFLGRKKLMLLTGPLAASGWTIIGLSTHIYLLYFGRFLCGLSSGFLLPACSVYISETVQAKLRGRLGSLNSLNMTLGILTSYTLGGFCPWRLSAFLCIIPATIFFLGLCFVPESPYWYLLKGKESEASESLAKLRGQHYPFKADIQDMASKISGIGFNISYKEFLERRTLIPLLVALFVQTLQQVCGSNTVIVYTSRIFEAANSSVNPQLATVYTGVAQLVGIIVSMMLIDRYGRRFLLTMSVGLAGISIGLLGGYYITLNTPNACWPQWIPLLLILCVVFTFCLGTRSIPWLYGSELFNTCVRSKANSFIVFYNRALNLICIQAFPYTVKAFGEAAVFLTYGVLSLLCAVGTLILVPETKGKTLEEIQEHFERRPPNAEGKCSS